MSLTAFPSVLKHEFSLWHHVLKLLRLRWTLFYSGFKRASKRRKIFTVAGLIFVIAIFAGIFIGSMLLMNLIRSPALAEIAPDLDGFVEAIPVLVFAGSFLAILLTSFGLLLQALYLSGDMDFLLSAPIPIRAVFISKLIQAILPNFTLIALSGIPLLYGIGASGGYNILYYLFVPVVLAFIAMAAAGISSILVMGIVHLVPARRVAEVLAFLGATISILCSQINALSRGFDVEQVTPEMLADNSNVILSLANSWSPISWAGRGLVELGNGNWLPAILFTSLTIGLAGLAFYFSLTTAEKLYYSGWASVQLGTRRKKTSKHETLEKNQRLRLFEKILPAPVRAIVVKDILVTRRDLRNMSQVVTPMIFGLIYAVMMLRGGDDAPLGRGEAPPFVLEVIKSAWIYGSVGISLFVGWSLNSRLALLGFSLEGKSYWLLKTSPVSAGKLLLSKFLIAYVPTILMGMLFLLGITLVRKAPYSIVLYALPAIALILAGLTGINLAFGVKGANLDWENAQKISTRKGSGCLSAIVTVIYLGFSLVLFFAPPLVLSFFQLSELMGQLIGMILGGIFSLAAAILPILWVKPLVYRIGE
ncbi:MAG: hypothetical protein EHM41_02625 [Chloroflexi bacterium]|nr:MAG: hypothetical protein EHM41_02625 [Chloroflexota bacterium]